MNNKKNILLSAVPSLILIATPAMAVDLSSDTVSASLDTTLSYGITARVQERDLDLVGIGNGGNAYGANADDGNLNYNRGVVSNTAKITSELEMSKGDFGGFFRASAFYDRENKDGERNRTELSDEAQELVGSDLDLLDAYIWSQFDVADNPGEIRVGNQLLSWGESTFIQNSINTINPVDAGKIRVPGAELREALVPVPMISGSLSPTENSTIEAFYQLRWEKTEADPTGSYFSVNDFAGTGGDRVMLGWGEVPDNIASGVVYPGQTTDSVVSRGEDKEAKDDGQYGIALRMYVPDLNDTEFGFYFINYHSRLPLIGARTGTEATVLGSDPSQTYIESARYFISYPEDIKLYGLSFNTSLGRSGIALQGEISYRQDMPLQIDDVEILFAALGAQANAAPSSPLASDLANYGQLGLVPFETDIPGYIRRDVTQAQVTATKMFGPGLGADATVVLGEVGVTSVIGMPDKDVLRLNGPGTFISGNKDLAYMHHGGAYEDASHFADATSWGYRLVTRQDFNNTLFGATLSPRIVFQHDVNGVSPGPAGNFVEGRKTITLGLAANYQNAYTADISYTRYAGAGRYNLVHDRDFIAGNIKYSF